MLRSRLGLKVLGLSALVVGLMAFVTSGVAQAETGAKWTYINPTTLKLETFTSALLPVAGIKLDSITKTIFFKTGGGTEVSITCTGEALSGEPKLLENGSISEGQSVMTGCNTFLNGKLSAACLPKTSGAANDEIKTNKFVGLLELHKLAASTDDVILLIPVVKNAKGETLAATIEMGEECSIGSTVPVTGSLVVYDCPPSTILEHLVEHLIEEFPALRLLKALGQPATIKGSSWLFLIGAHKGFKFAGLPN